MATLYSWGSGKYSQHGHANTEDQTWPKRIASVEFGAKSVAVGPRFCIALSNTGDLWSWGRGLMGELGLAYLTESLTPMKITKVPEGTKFKAVAVGGEHAIAVTVDGVLYCWGGNDLGQLGVGNVKPSDRPIPVKIPDPKEKFVSVACGWKHSCALTEQGALYVWGGGWGSQLGEGEVLNVSLPKKLPSTFNNIEVQWKDVKCADNCTFAITTRGKIYSWGSGGHGRLGHGDTKMVPSPKMIEALSKMDHKFVDVAVGYDHAIARTDKGVLVSWGAGAHAALGQKTCNRQLQPKVVPISEKVSFKSVAAGMSYTIAISNDGDAYVWGDMANGRLGNGKSSGLQVEPMKLDTDLIFNEIFCGRDNVVAIGSGIDRPPKALVAEQEAAAAAAAAEVDGTVDAAPSSSSTDAPANAEQEPAEAKATESTEAAVEEPSTTTAEGADESQ